MASGKKLRKQQKWERRRSLPEKPPAPPAYPPVRWGNKNWTEIYNSVPAYHREFLWRWAAVNQTGWMVQPVFIRWLGAYRNRDVSMSRAIEFELGDGLREVAVARHLGRIMPLGDAVMGLLLDPASSSISSSYFGDVFSSYDEDGRLEAAAWSEEIRWGATEAKPYSALGITRLWFGGYDEIFVGTPRSYAALVAVPSALPQARKLASRFGLKALPLDQVRGYPK